ncbi:response regulator receiver modulated metal dependent phosphohydrolase [Flexistipes sinusarabici DSM 4947]|uniref:Response regulator receiver modulated metal dependent phosphohydrolase n=1 Tax=Flexistipes sinusarabici (strain ATCC 49648 / DSM 4947 / MAS 10) TaxID=717231 RepID=F8E6K0_FLESM|nr:HD-GYP domain-containing protein [Flexistipes sinusarabici]AEI14837.1 response regulator receiver modulated metal dependent phosphohydrolase [Flexistipes sinusarabici DSM 4947]
MSSHINVLIAGGDNCLKDKITEILREEGFNIFSADQINDVINLLKYQCVDIILAASGKNDAKVAALLKKLKGSGACWPEVIVLATEPDINKAVEFIRAGAFDYLVKPFNKSDVVRRVYEAFNHNKEMIQVLNSKQISSIYESSQIYSKTLHQDKIFSHLLKTVQNEFKISGVYIKTFKRNYVNTYNLDFNIIQYMDCIFDYNKSWEIFQNEKVLLGTYKENSNSHYLVLPMFNSEGLWGIFVFFRKGDYRFNETEIKILNIHINQYSIALQNIFRFEQMTKGYMETIASLSKAVDSKDAYTRGHSENVKKYSLEISREMGMNKEFKDLIRYAGLLHDIGKIGVSSDIINKSSKLDNAEYHEMKKHPLYGHEILKPIKFLEAASDFVLHHHEKMDGSGYPYGLKKKEIPLGARILQISDAFDAMTTDRSYRPKRPVREAVEELDFCSGVQFDPEIVSAFKSVLNKKPGVII